MSKSNTNATLFLDTLNKQPSARTPVWMMRQAGRYLPEYRAIRSKVSGFMELCQTPELACEVTLQPLKRFELDAAIIFSDILVIPDAMGLGLHFVADHGPAFKNVPDPSEYAHLPIPEPESDLKYVLDAIKLVKHEIAGHTPLIGFCGSPWTVATYVVEGQSAKQFSKIRALMYRAPEALHTLLNKLTEASILYLKAQARAGVDALMIFDTWGGLLGPGFYHTFTLAYMKKIVAALKSDATIPQVPVILFSKNGGQFLEDMAESGCAGLGLDWTCDIAKARQRVGRQVVLQGNLDPAILLSSPDVVRQEVAKMLKAFGKGNGHIVNLGHGIYPETPIENVVAFLEAVRTMSPSYHGAEHG